MKNSGWEMRPAGWILLFILGAFLLFFVNQWVQNRSRKSPEEPS